jgi:hypothetical protein
MRVRSTLRFLSVPAAIALATALGVACSDGVTAPDQLGPSFTVRTVYRDDDGAGNCTKGYTAQQFAGSPDDVNLNGIVCYKSIGHKHK